MHCYLIVGTTIETADVREKFPNCYEVRSGVWAVASELETSAQVSDLMGFLKPQTGIVFKITQFYGYYDKALWESLNAWMTRA